LNICEEVYVHSSTTVRSDGKDFSDGAVVPFE
jgi:hypothetical protein